MALIVLALLFSVDNADFHRTVDAQKQAGYKWFELEECRVVKENLPKNIEVTHKSLFDNSIEGIKLKNKPIFSVQYHPESNPGPQDSVYLFQEFINNMKKNAKKKRS